MAEYVFLYCTGAGIGTCNCAEGRRSYRMLMSASGCNQLRSQPIRIVFDSQLSTAALDIMIANVRYRVLFWQWWRNSARFHGNHGVCMARTGCELAVDSRRKVFYTYNTWDGHRSCRKRTCELCARWADCRRRRKGLFLTRNQGWLMGDPDYFSISLLDF